MFIVHACEITNIFEYSSLLQFIGPIWEIFGAIAICYVSFSTCLGYCILIPQFIQPAMKDIFEIDNFNYDKQLYVLIFAIFILYPLALLKNMRNLRYSSSIGIIAIFYCVGLLIFELSKLLDENDAPGTSNGATGDFDDNFGANEWGLGVFICINVCAKAFVCHYSLPPIYESLEKRSINRMWIVMIISYFIVTLIYLLFAVSGYYLFGTDSKANILDNFDDTDVIPVSIARICMAIALCGCYPLVFKSGINAIEDKFFNPNKSININFRKQPILRVIIITFIVASITIISLFLDDIGPVSSIEGAVTVLFLICIFPILIIWRLGFYGGETSNLLKKFEYLRPESSPSITPQSIPQCHQCDDSNIEHQHSNPSYLSMGDNNNSSNNNVELPNAAPIDANDNGLGIGDVAPDHSVPGSLGLDIDAEAKINSSNLIEHDRRNSVNDTDHLLPNAIHNKQNTVIIKSDIDLYGVELNPGDDEAEFVMIKDGGDICQSVYLSLMLTLGIVLGIFGVIMSISVIYGWY